MALHDLDVAPALAQRLEARIHPVQMRRSTPMVFRDHNMKRLAREWLIKRHNAPAQAHCHNLGGALKHIDRHRIHIARQKRLKTGLGAWRLDQRDLALTDPASARPVKIIGNVPRRATQAVPDDIGIALVGETAIRAFEQHDRKIKQRLGKMKILTDSVVSQSRAIGFGPGESHIIPLLGQQGKEMT